MLVSYETVGIRYNILHSFYIILLSRLFWTIANDVIYGSIKILAQNLTNAVKQ